MDWLIYFGIASLITSAITSVVNTGANIVQNEKAMKQQKEMQETIFNREDTAYQRTVEDMQKAGLSPLGMGSTNNAGSVVSASNFKLDNPFGQMSSEFANIGNSSTSLALQERARLDDLNHQKEVLNWEKLKYNNDASFRNETLNKLKEEINSLNLDNRQKRQILDELARMQIPLVQYEKGLPEVTQGEISLKRVKNEIDDATEPVENVNSADSGLNKDNFNKPNTREHTVYIRTKDKLSNQHQSNLIQNYINNELYQDVPEYKRSSLQELQGFLNELDSIRKGNNNAPVSDKQLKQAMSKLSISSLNTLENIVKSNKIQKYPYRSK